MPRLAKLGYEFGISCFFGQQLRMSEWQGMPCYGGGATPYGPDVLKGHAEHFGADLVITLMDQWALDPSGTTGLKMACWMPVDSSPLSQLDRKTLPGRWPIAMTRFGETELRRAGYKALYVPHGIETDVFIPPLTHLGRKDLRVTMGVDDKFVFFMNAANKDKGGRKSFLETIDAFAQLHQRHPDTLLVLHTQEESPEGLNLGEFVQLMGVKDAVVFSAQYMTLVGHVPAEALRGSYGMADCYLCPSRAEGFGTTILEAMACGLPCIIGDNSAMPEVAGGAGWKLKGEEQWVPGHRAKWSFIPARNILAAMERAYEKGDSYRVKQKAARPQAMKYNVDHVVETYWGPALEQLEARL